MTHDRESPRRQRRQVIEVGCPKGNCVTQCRCLTLTYINSGVTAPNRWQTHTASSVALVWLLCPHVRVPLPLVSFKLSSCGNFPPIPPLPRTSKCLLHSLSQQNSHGRWLLRARRGFTLMGFLPTHRRSVPRRMIQPSKQLSGKNRQRLGQRFIMAKRLFYSRTFTILTQRRNRSLFASSLSSDLDLTC